MRSPPHLKNWYHFPTVSFVGIAAILVTIVYWKGEDQPPLWESLDVSLLLTNFLAWRGELWRFVTSALPHVHPLHLAFNLFWLWVFGTHIEKVFGWWKTALLFVLFATGSGVAEYALLRGGVGLSGVGYGMFGLLYILSYEDERFEGAVDPLTTTLFIGWFIVCCYLTARNILPVANVAHAMGFVLGILTGLVIARHGVLRIVFASVVAAVMVLTLLAGSVFRAEVNLDGRAGEDIALYAYHQLERGHNATAVSYYKDALAMNPSRSRWWYNLNVAYLRMEKLEESRKALEKAAELAPSNVKYQQILAHKYFQLAAEKFRANELDKAIEWARKGLDVYDQKADYWYRMGLYYRLANDREKALRAFRKATEQDATNPRFLRAVRELERKKPKK